MVIIFPSSLHAQSLIHPNVAPKNFLSAHKPNQHIVARVTKMHHAKSDQVTGKDIGRGVVYFHITKGTPIELSPQKL